MKTIVLLLGLTAALAAQSLTISHVTADGLDVTNHGKLAVFAYSVNISRTETGCGSGFTEDFTYDPAEQIQPGASRHVSIEVPAGSKPTVTGITWANGWAEGAGLDAHNTVLKTTRDRDLATYHNAETILSDLLLSHDIENDSRVAVRSVQDLAAGTQGKQRRQALDLASFLSTKLERKYVNPGELLAEVQGYLARLNSLTPLHFSNGEPVTVEDDANQPHKVSSMRAALNDLHIRLANVTLTQRGYFQDGGDQDGGPLWDWFYQYPEPWFPYQSSRWGQMYLIPLEDPRELSDPWDCLGGGGLSPGTVAQFTLAQQWVAGCVDSHGQRYYREVKTAQMVGGCAREKAPTTSCGCLYKVRCFPTVNQPQINPVGGSWVGTLTVQNRKAAYAGNAVVCPNTSVFTYTWQCTIR